MTPRARWALLALAVVAAFGAGWLAHRRVLTRAQRGWVAAVDSSRAETQRALGAVMVLGAAAARASLEGRALRAEAATAEGRQNAALADARGLRGRLASARTAADSIPPLLGIIERQDTALAAATERARAAEAAYRSQLEATVRLAEAAALLEQRVAAQDSLLARGVEVIGDSECRIPLLGLRCPAVGPGVGTGLDGEVRFQVAVIYPVQPW